MGKKLRILLLTATLTCFASTFVNATTTSTADSESTVTQNTAVTVDGFEYKTNNDGTVEISKYTGNKTEITIPSTIEDKRVTSVGDYAFSGCSGLTTINIPSSVTSIGNHAFSGCSGLTTINIPDSVTSIGDYAFSGCSGLTTINIPDSVTSIGDHAFDGCSGLTTINVNDNNAEYSSQDGVLYDKDKITLIKCPEGKKNIINIPSSVTSIGDDAFSGCSGLTTINVNDNNAEYSSQDGVLYDKDKKTLIKCPKGKKNIINILDSVTFIEWYAFDGCSGLTTINIPSSVTSIESCAFLGCSELTTINIPDSVISIGDNAFDGCSGFTIYGQKNSYVQKFAQDNSIPFKLSSEYEKDISASEDPVNKYIVKFINEDGTQVGEIQEVEEGKSAIAPADPTKEGYTFKGWDKNFSKVTSNLEVKAIFEKNPESSQDKPNEPSENQSKNKYTVKFINEDGTQVGETEEVEEGKSAIAPANPTKEGYTFKGWDKDFSEVTSNLEVKAIFEKNPSEEQQAAKTPSSNTDQATKTPTNEDETNKKTSDASSVAGLFTMFAGLSGIIGFRKRKNS